MGVLQLILKGTDIPPECRELSTRFVTTWRAMRFHQRDFWMRRARLVGREYQWMSCERDGGRFAPASSNIIQRILPSATQHRSDYAMFVLDFKDAFLTVDQQKPTAVFAYVRGERLTYRLHECLPGQRDASANWHDDVAGRTRSGRVESCRPETEASLEASAAPVRTPRRALAAFGADLQRRDPCCDVEGVLVHHGLEAVVGSRRGQHGVVRQGDGAVHGCRGAVLFVATAPSSTSKADWSFLLARPVVSKLRCCSRAATSRRGQGCCRG